jgi:hypothetical protein
MMETVRTFHLFGSPAGQPCNNCSGLHARQRSERWNWSRAGIDLNHRWSQCGHCLQSEWRENGWLIYDESQEKVMRIISRD